MTRNRKLECHYSVNGGSCHSPRPAGLFRLDLVRRAVRGGARRPGTRPYDRLAVQCHHRPWFWWVIGLIVNVYPFLLLRLLASVQLGITRVHM